MYKRFSDLGSGDHFKIIDLLTRQPVPTVLVKDKLAARRVEADGKLCERPVYIPFDVEVVQCDKNGSIQGAPLRPDEDAQIDVQEHVRAVTGNPVADLGIHLAQAGSGMFREERGLYLGRYCVDGLDYDDKENAPFVGDGIFPPFKVFDVQEQSYVLLDNTEAKFDTREEAEKWMREQFGPLTVESALDLMESLVPSMGELDRPAAHKAMLMLRHHAECCKGSAAAQASFVNDPQSASYIPNAELVMAVLEGKIIENKWAGNWVRMKGREALRLLSNWNPDDGEVRLALEPVTHWHPCWREEKGMNGLFIAGAYTERKWALEGSRHETDPQGPPDAIIKIVQDPRTLAILFTEVEVLK